MKTHLRRLPMLLSGSAILAFGLCHIHAYAPITEGGILGLILLLDQFLFQLHLLFSDNLQILQNGLMHIVQ